MANYFTDRHGGRVLTAVAYHCETTAVVGGFPVTSASKLSEAHRILFATWPLFAGQIAGSADRQARRWEGLGSRIPSQAR